MPDRHVLNPSGGPVDIPNVDAFLAHERGAGLEPHVDLGGGMVVPLTELIEGIPATMTCVTCGFVASGRCGDCDAWVCDQHAFSNGDGHLCDPQDDL